MALAFLAQPAQAPDSNQLNDSIFSANSREPSISISLLKITAKALTMRNTLQRASEEEAGFFSHADIERMYRLLPADMTADSRADLVLAESLTSLKDQNLSAENAALRGMPESIIKRFLQDASKKLLSLGRPEDNSGLYEKAVEELRNLKKVAEEVLKTLLPEFDALKTPMLAIEAKAA
jgi:hypothetical protein